jgi:uncharacterized membrane protein YphA (DoxX/SURF4 family)
MNHKVVPVLRILLGLPFLVFGLNGFYEFMPAPEHTGVAQEYWAGLAASRYFVPLLSSTKIAVGVLLIIGRLVPLALVVLAPIMINIVAYHLYVEAEGLPLAVGLAALQLVLAFVYRRSFTTLFRGAGIEG